MSIICGIIPKIVTSLDTLGLNNIYIDNYNRSKNVAPVFVYPDNEKMSGLDLFKLLYENYNLVEMYPVDTNEMRCIFKIRS